MSRLDDVVHSPVRFTIMAALSTVDDATYQILKQELDVSYALLSKHAGILEDHGYLRVHKSFLAKKPQTVFALTPQGRQAFNHHVQALDEIRHGL
ncbi:winged helix-turn-helix domain-containing protein [Serinicoccus chungangensis]|uniref:winged helix-turn-helix domain-containing protein n=1 Tax=Serinicoccus chungangensis TaxID=767452 RepID=UPI0011180BE8|nr:transcriptional regulator [Serinicoccus chungangensis]